MAQHSMLVSTEHRNVEFCEHLSKFYWVAPTSSHVVLNTKTQMQKPTRVQPNKV
jgi:hypothetical protein